MNGNGKETVTIKAKKTKELPEDHAFKTPCTVQKRDLTIKII